MSVSTSFQWLFWGASHAGFVTEDCLVPTLIFHDLFENVSSLHTSGRHSLVLIDGQVFAMGENEYGECGLDRKVHGTKIVVPVPVPLELAQGVKVKQVVCGFSNSGIITEQGELYLWGNNEQFQLGLGHKEYVNVPTLVSFERQEKISSVALGLFHSIALMNNGSVYAWGVGAAKKGKLITRKSETDYGIPFRLSFQAQQIAIGVRHSVFLNGL